MLDGLNFRLGEKIKHSRVITLAQYILYEKSEVAEFRTLSRLYDLPGYLQV